MMKKKNIYFWILIILMIIVIVTSVLFLTRSPKITNIIFSEEISENETQVMTIEFTKYNPFKVQCKINDEEWIDSKDNKCVYEVKTGGYNIELKNLFNIVSTTENVVINGIKSIALESEKIYLALDETMKLNTIIETVGNADTSLIWNTSNSEIVSVENGEITGLKTGEANITVYSKNNKSYTTRIIVTDLIKPMILNDNKTVVPCNVYTEEEAAILDDILKTRIEMKGEGTRAALIETIRFLTLSFEYKIPYFFENGRLKNYATIRYVDGEGRYYKKGLYLSESKKTDILASFAGPSIWGCPLTNYDDSYGWGIGVKYPNGLDCSGFVTWALFNAGIDIGDIGAGIAFEVNDLSDVGEMHELTYEFANSGNFKVGDIIARDGHTALIAGIDEEYIYIAESLLKGVRIEKFSYKDKNSKLYRLYGYINKLDNIYNSDGLYENMW